MSVGSRAACGSSDPRRGAPLVKAGLLTIAPSGIAPDPSSPLPMQYSPTRFEERVSAALREWLRSRARVHGLWKADVRGVSSDEPLTSARTIGIVFDGLNQAMAFRLTPSPVERQSHDRDHCTQAFRCHNEAIGEPSHAPRISPPRVRPTMCALGRHRQHGAAFLDPQRCYAPTAPQIWPAPEIGEE